MRLLTQMDLRVMTPYQVVQGIMANYKGGRFGSSEIGLVICTRNDSSPYYYIHWANNTESAGSYDLVLLAIDNDVEFYAPA